MRHTMSELLPYIPVILFVLTITVIPRLVARKVAPIMSALSDCQSKLTSVATLTSGISAGVAQVSADTANLVAASDTSALIQMSADLDNVASGLTVAIASLASSHTAAAMAIAAVTAPVAPMPAPAPVTPAV